jgi:voltage-gated potassium channel
MTEESSQSPKKEPLKQRLWEIVFEAETRMGKAFDVTLLVAIGLSVLAVMFESVDSVAEEWGPLLRIAEWTFTIFFTLEYFLRIYLARRSSRYIFSFFGIVDLLSWIPSFLAFFVPGGQSLLVIRILRLLRMFRVLKMFEHVRGANVIMTALISSRAKITVFFFAVFLLAVIMGTLAYLLESGSQSGFNSIPESVYWAIVTITTVGYGDMAPVTVAGKLLGSFVMLTGYCVIAVPTGIMVGEVFSAAKKQDETTDACPSCGVHGHLVDARFCRRCGEKLHEPSS